MFNYSDDGTGQNVMVLRRNCAKKNVLLLQLSVKLKQYALFRIKMAKWRITQTTPYDRAWALVF